MHFSNKRHLVILSAGIGAVILASLLPLRAPFFFVDDPLYVSRNELLRSVPLSQFWRLFTMRTNPFEYLPLRDLTYRLEIAAFGLAPAAFRITNLVLYLLSCWAVWLGSMEIGKIFRRNDSREKIRWLATVTTLLFALHPAHVESVVWISGRKDVLSGMFALASLWLFAAAVNSSGTDWRRLGLSYFCFACAILSKSTVVPLPAVALLLLIARADSPRFRKDVIRRAVKYTGPLFLLALVSVALQVFDSSALAGGAAHIAGAFHGLGSKLLLAAKILGMLARIEFFPVNMRLIYDVQAPGAVAVETLSIGIAAGALTLAGIWFGVRKRSLSWFGICMSGLLILPFLQIIPFLTWSYASERFLFLPVLGACLTIASLLRNIPARIQFAVVGVIALCFAGVTVQRCRQWRSAKELIVSDAQLSPGNSIAARLVINHVMIPDKRFDEARKAARRVWMPSQREELIQYVDAVEAERKGDLATLRKIVPKIIDSVPKDDFMSQNEVADMAAEVGMYREAETLYRKIIRNFSDTAEVHYNLGRALEHQNRHKEAVEEMQRGFDMGFKSADAWNNLGLAARNAGQEDLAVHAFRESLDADPLQWKAGYNLARLLFSRGDRSGALNELGIARERAVKAGESTAPIDELIKRIAP